jgi:hypothetical protein
VAGNEYHSLVNPGAVLPRRGDPTNPYSISKILFEIDGADLEESLAGGALAPPWRTGTAPLRGARGRVRRRPGSRRWAACSGK